MTLYVDIKCFMYLLRLQRLGAGFYTELKFLFIYPITLLQLVTDQ